MRLLLLPVSLLSCLTVFAQHGPYDLGCNQLPSSPAEISDCFYCPDYGIVYGTTEDNSPSSTNFTCGTIENDQYIAFWPGSNTEITLIATFCLFNDGIQFQLLDPNGQQTNIDCISQLSPGIPYTISLAGLPISDEPYYIRIDGFAGDICEFELDIQGAAYPPTGPFDPIITYGQNTTTISTSLPFKCPGRDTIPGVQLPGCYYYTDFIIDPADAGTGSQTINQNSFDIDFLWTRNDAIRAEVIRTFTLADSDPGFICEPYFEEQYFTHFLDLIPSYTRPLFWGCDEQRYAGLIEDRGSAEIIFSGLGTQRVVIEGAGYLGRSVNNSHFYFEYALSNATGSLFAGALSEVVWSDTIVLDFSDGPITLEMYTDKDWPIEYAITLLDGALASGEVVFDPLILEQGDSVLVFENLAHTQAFYTSTAGIFRDTVGCVTYVQEVLTNQPLVSIDLGTQVLCDTDCLLTSSGDTISCGAGFFSVTLSNDTTYSGTIELDYTLPIAIEEVTYSCDSLTGNYFMHISWSGSSAPYTLAGVQVVDTFSTSGPYRNGQSVSLFLQGASTCHAGIFVAGEHTCSLSSIEETALQDVMLIRHAPHQLEIRGLENETHVWIIDALGRQQASKSISPGSAFVDTQALSSGFYVVLLQDFTGQRAIPWVLTH